MTLAILAKSLRVGVFAVGCSVTLCVLGRELVRLALGRVA